MHTRVALTQGTSRYDNVTRALALISDDIQIRGCRQVVIKPNLVSPRRQLPSAHVDAVRAVLDYVRSQYDGRLLIAEGAAISSTWEAFRYFGYPSLAESYQAELVDLNADEIVAVQVYNSHLRPVTMHLARTIVASDMRISVGPPKTHDTVIVTLSLKNMVLGSLVNRAVVERLGARRWSVLSQVAKLIPRRLQQSWLVQLVKVGLLGVRNDKMAMHQGFPVINLNLAMLAPWVAPHLAIIDGFRAMEGAGPMDGAPVDWRIALAGTDAVAVDSLTAHLMGFDPKDIGYLDYCQRLKLGVGNLDQITVAGDVALNSVRRQLQPHPTYKRQKNWYLSEVEKLLSRAPEVAYPTATHVKP